jgi:hypothetical protein
MDRTLSLPVWSVVPLGLLGLLLTACGGGAEAQVPVDAEHLRGYWLAEDAANKAPSPALMHFGVQARDDEAPAGAPTVETAGMSGDASIIGPYELVAGKHLRFQQNVQGETGTYLEGDILSLTADTLVLQQFQDLGTITFHRTAGCGGPGLWFGPSFFEVREAGWDPQGALHMLTTDNTRGTTDYYVYIPPDRCTVYTPKTSLTGQSLDVARDGTIRIVTLQPPTSAGPAEIALSEVPPAPWARPTLDPVIRNEVIPELPSSSAVTRTGEDEDGQAIVLWAHGDELHTLTDAGGSFTHATLTLHHSGPITPNFLRVDHQPGGSFVVRGELATHGQRYDHGTWSDWTAEDTPVSIGGTPIIATVFAYDKAGNLHAAWAEGGTPGKLDAVDLMLGRRHADGTWDKVAAGVGAPFDLQVRDDGSVDIAAMRNASEAPVAWIHVAASFADGAWTEGYTLNPNGTFNFSTGATLFPNWPVARFGPSHEIFVGGYNGAWRRPALEKQGEVFRWQPLKMTFDGDVGVTVDIPATGDSCSADCTLLVPPSAILFAHLTPAASGAHASLSGSVKPIGGGWAIFSDINIDGLGKKPVEVFVHGSLQHAEVAQVAGSTQVLGASVNAAGDLVVVTRDASPVPSILVQKAAGGAPVAVTFTGGAALQPNHNGVRALAAGGWVVPVLGAPTLTGGKAGVVFLDDALAVTQVQAFNPSDRAVALASDGFRELHIGSTGALEVIAHTAAGAAPAVATELIEANDAAALGDGVVVYTAMDYGTVSQPTSVDAHVWTGVTAAGATAWRLVGDPHAEVAWDVEDDDLVIYARYQQPWALGAETFPRVPGADNASIHSEAVVRVDGKTGAIKQSRGGLPSNYGAASDVALAPDGVVVLTAMSVATYFQRVPWGDGAVEEVRYQADDSNPTCLMMSCGTARGFLQRAPQGYAGAWDTALLDYDGVPIDPVQGAVVYGTWAP